MKKNPSLEEYLTKCGEIKGHAVEQPLNFLDKEDLVVGAANLIPDQLVT